LAEVGEELLNFCHPEHAVRLNEQLLLAEKRLLSGDALGGLEGGSAESANNGYSVTNLPPAGRSHTQGTKRLLLMRVLFADDPVPPISEDGSQSLTRQNNQYYVDNSFNTTEILTMVTPLIRLPQGKLFYGEGLGDIWADGYAIALSMGFTENYDFEIGRAHV